MGSGANVVLRIRVRSELAATLRAPPRLRSRDQGSANAMSSSLRQNEPAFEIRDSIAAAPLSKWPNGYLREALYATVSVFSEEHHPWIAREVATKEPVHFFAVLRL